MADTGGMRIFLPARALGCTQLTFKDSFLHTDPSVRVLDSRWIVETPWDADRPCWDKGGTPGTPGHVAGFTHRSDGKLRLRRFSVV